MSKLIIDSIEPKSGSTISIQGDIAITGNLNGIPVTILTGNTGFTGNTSSDCITEAYINTIYGCNDEYVNSPNLFIPTNTVVYGDFSATTLYGNSQNLTNLNYPNFTYNTSGDCIQELWVQSLDGCNGNVTVNGNLTVNGTVSATTYYGDASGLNTAVNNIIPTGTGITNVSSYLEYGTNLISTADTENFCVRLPQTPIKGREVGVINTSGFDIFVYPSMAGGSINGVLNGASIVPSDSQLYTFTCYENPAPGSWSQNYVQSTGQYDSGVISIDNSVGGQLVSAYDDNFKHQTSNFSSANGFAIDGLNQPYIGYVADPIGTCGSSSGLCQVVYFKPVVPWSFIDKITVFTNFSTGLTAGGIFKLVYGKDTGYYSAGTNNYYLGSGPGGGSGSAFGSPTQGIANQMIAGNALSNYSLNPGDSGTWWGELNFSLSGRPSQIGDILLSSGTFNVFGYGNVNADFWQTTTIGFMFDTNQNSTDTKFRFLIDYTI